MVFFPVFLAGTVAATVQGLYRDCTGTVQGLYRDCPSHQIGISFCDCRPFVHGTRGHTERSNPCKMESPGSSMNPPPPFINVERFEASRLLISFGNGWVACAPWATLSLGGSGGECPGDSISHGVDRYVMLKNQEAATNHPRFCTMPVSVRHVRELCLRVM